MKQTEKKRTNNILNHDLNITVDEKLNALKGKVLAPEKLAKANKSLSKIKSLPK